MPASHENFSLDLHKTHQAETITLLNQRMAEKGWDKKRQLMDEMLSVYLKHISGDDASAEMSPPAPPAMTVDLTPLLGILERQNEIAVRQAKALEKIAASGIAPRQKAEEEFIEEDEEEGEPINITDELVQRLASPNFDDF